MYTCGLIGHELIVFQDFSGLRTRSPNLANLEPNKDPRDENGKDQ